MSDYSPTELMAVVMARNFKDGEVVVMGAVPALPLASARLAKQLWAPNLSYIVGGSGTVNAEPEALPSLSCVPELSPAPSVLPLPEVVLLEGRGDALDVFCAGGLQIDMFGNTNLIAIGDWESPALRGPGTVGLPFLPAVRRSLIYTQAHNPRVLVEKVDFISGPGHSAEAAGRYGTEGPSLVVTPLAAMDFDPGTGRMRLASVHPGVDPEEVQNQTGFELIIPADVQVTPQPTEDELAALRSLDPGRALSR